MTDTRPFRWARIGGYEVSTRGDSRFSAFNAILPSGVSIEQAYQESKGLNCHWKEAKGKPPADPSIDLWPGYLELWRVWTQHHMPLMRELFLMVRGFGDGCTLSDRFATTATNQARALAIILNKLCGFE
jgi:hypothetical protein